MYHFWMMLESPGCRSCCVITMIPKYTWTDDNPEYCSVTLKKLVKVMHHQYILRT